MTHWILLQIVQLVVAGTASFLDETQARIRYSWNSNHTLNMEDICHQSKNPVVRLSNSGFMSYGYLLVTKVSQETILNSANCTVRFKANQGHGITMAFRKIATDHYCSSYIQIFNGYTDDILSDPICGTENDKSEQNYVYSTIPKSASLRLFLYLSNQSNFPVDFQLTFTVFSNGEFEPCVSSTLYMCRNRRCISKQLLCDGHNNCGDLSDEQDNGICNVVAPSNSFSTGSYVGILVSLLILVLIFLFIVVPRPQEQRFRWLRSFRRRRISRRSNPIDPNYRPRGRSIPRTSSTGQTMGVATLSVSLPIRYLPNSPDISCTVPQLYDPPPNYSNPVFQNDENPPPYAEAVQNSKFNRRSRSH